MISFMHLPPNMDHNEFDFIDDLVNPFKEFIRRLGDDSRVKRNDLEESKINDEDRVQQ